MKTETINRLIGDLDDEALSCEFEAKASRPRKAFRFAAAAAALIVAAGAAFGIVNAASSNNGAKLPAQYAFMADTSVPKDAVLPPVQVGGGSSDARYLKNYDLAQMYEAADAVCMVTIRNWLSETKVGTYFEAEVERVYKGELPETIVIFQMGNSEYHMEDSPLYTYGDKLLVGLIPWKHSIYPGAYDIVGTDIAMLYAAASDEGGVYLIDHRGVMSMETEQNIKDHPFTNYASDEKLVNELLDYINSYDNAIYSELQGYYRTSDPSDTRYFHVYSLEQIESFFSEIGNN